MAPKSPAKPLVFLGTNSVLERYIEAADRQNQSVAGIVDSDWYGNRKTFADIPVIAGNQDLLDNIEYWRDNYVFFVATNWLPTSIQIQGVNRDSQNRDINKRSDFCATVDKFDLSCINLIDPTSYVSGYAKLGKGIFIGANVSVEPYVQIDDYAQLWSGISVGHHSHIGRNTVLQRESGLYGKIGQECYVGVGTHIVRDGTSVIGDNVVIAPGLTVFRDVDSGEHVRMNTASAKVYRRAMPSQ